MTKSSSRQGHRRQADGQNKRQASGKDDSSSPFLPARAQRRRNVKHRPPTAKKPPPPRRHRRHEGHSKSSRTVLQVTTEESAKDSPFAAPHRHRPAPRKETKIQTKSLPKTNTVPTQKSCTTDTLPAVSRDGPRSIDKQAIAQLPVLAWQGPVHVLSRRAETQAAVQHLLSQACNQLVLGFDTETKPVYRKGQYEPPALVQLASATDVYLFQLLPHRTLDLLLPLFEASHILKVGVSIQNDVKELQRVYKFKAAGFVELSDRTRELGYTQGGLRALTALLLGGNLRKKMQMSNWAKPVLCPQQVTYAATDAYVGRALYLRVLEEEKALLQKGQLLGQAKA